MSLYRCAACGSPNVIADTQTGGISYNYKKGVVGTLVLGVGGAVAGVESITKQVFKCPDCGQTISYAMPEELKNAIDMGVSDFDARKCIKLMGVPIAWETFTSRYKNIESGTGDIIASMREKSKKKSVEFYNKVLETGRAADKAYLESGGASEEAIALWKIEYQAVQEKIQNDLPEAIEKERDCITEAYNSKVDRLNHELQSAEASKEALKNDKKFKETTAASLGLLRIAQKNKIKAEIENISNEIHRLEAQINEGPEKAEQLREEYNKQIGDVKTIAVEKIRSQYPLPVNPNQKKIRIDYINNHEFRDRMYNGFQSFVLYYLEQCGASPWSDFVETSIGTNAFTGEAEEQINDCYGQNVGFRIIQAMFTNMILDGIIRCVNADIQRKILAGEHAIPDEPDENIIFELV